MTNIWVTGWQLDRCIAINLSFIIFLFRFLLRKIVVPARLRFLLCLPSIPHTTQNPQQSNLYVCVFSFFLRSSNLADKVIVLIGGNYFGLWIRRHFCPKKTFSKNISRLKSGVSVENALSKTFCLYSTIPKEGTYTIITTCTWEGWHLPIETPFYLTQESLLSRNN